MRVPFVSLERQYSSLRADFLAKFDQIAQSGTYIMGEPLQNFESEAAHFCETRFALGVANGSDALFLALKALNIGEGDEVITCPNSFIASAWVIVAAGAKPVFVDAGEDSNINVNLLEAAITPRTRAIIPVHLTGRPAEMNTINEIANRYQLAVIEDAAQAIGARYYNKRVGSLGAVAGFSLHPLKNLGVFGDGGLVTTNDPNIYERINKLRNHGLKNRDECEIWGYNSRLDSLQAGFAAIKLKHLDVWNKRCRDIASFYRESLRDLVKVPEDKPYEEPVYHNFIIQLERRNDLMAYLESCGVGCRIHYPIPIHLQECARSLGYQQGDFPVVERLSRTILSLPIYPELMDNEIEYVVTSIRNFFKTRVN